MGEKLVWIDGEILPASEFRLDPDDEGLLYGRGVFTTTRTFGGIPWLWNRHVDRLLKSAKRIGVPIDAESIPSSDEVTRFAESQKLGDVVVRVNVASSKGREGRRVWMIARPLPASVDSIRLTISGIAHGVDDLSGWKSFNYLARHLAYCDARDRGFDDAILLAPTKQVLETAHSNLFLRLGSHWITPPLGQGVLNGTVRQVLLESAVDLIESPFNVDELMRVEEIVVTNSVHGVVSVQEIDGREYRTTDATQLIQNIVANERP